MRKWLEPDGGETDSRRRGRSALLLLFLLGIAVLAARNPDPWLHPAIYAEDGTWTALGLRNGWLNALQAARPDYLVAFNILLIMLSAGLSHAASGSPLWLLPQAMALLSCAFFAATATLGFAVLRRAVPAAWALMGWALLLLLPMGDSQNEVIGRVLQVGFFMPVVAVLLLWLRGEDMPAFSRGVADAVLLLCVLTNPLVLPLVALGLLPDVLRLRSAKAFLRRNGALLLGCALYALFLLPRLGRTGAEMAGASLQLASLVETALARPLLYPLVFPFYTLLGDGLVAAGSVLFAAMVVVAWRAEGPAGSRRWIAILAAALVLCTVATIAGRPGLTGFLGGYRSTFPDRYFMGLNALAALLWLLCLARLAGSPRWRPAALALAWGTLAVYAAGLPRLFEWEAPRMRIHTGEDFRAQLCASELFGARVEMARSRIAPAGPGWRMRVPERHIPRAACPPGSRATVAAVPASGETIFLKPSMPLERTEPLILWMLPDTAREQAPLQRIGVMLATFGHPVAGRAELWTKERNGTVRTQVLELERVVDGAYHFFDLPPGHYLYAEIFSGGGTGVSTVERHGIDSFSCIVYEYAGGLRRQTPGCPPG